MGAEIFTGVQQEKAKSNIFDLTHDRKTTTVMGRLTPIMCEPVLPGDKWKFKTSVFTRFLALVSPFMHRVNLYCHTFFVPNRIVWPNWEKFITGGEDGDDASVWPYLVFDFETQAPGSLADHLGLPTAQGIATSPQAVSALPFAAYQHIFYEYYRDQNQLQYDKPMLVDGDNIAEFGALTEMHYRAWQHDYFTAALPWTQKGVEAMLPLGETAPIVLKDPAGGLQQIVRKGSDGTIQASVTQFQSAVGTAALIGTSGGYVDSLIDVATSHETDLSNATAASINDLRRAIALQKFLERNARSGSRYTEFLQVRWGVKPEDMRMQRPEYIGGYSQPVQVSEVLQTGPPTAEVGGQTPIGTMAGHGISVGSGGYNGYFAKEHGYIITIMSIMPMSQYFQGIPRHFLKSDRFDHYFHEFDHIGEQAIENRELMVTDSNNTDTWGYTPRYAEYRFINNSVHGLFRTSLDFWHLARKFATRPGLNIDFIQFDPSDAERVFAVADSEDNLLCHVLNEVQVGRQMSVFATPGGIF